MLRIALSALAFVLLFWLSGRTQVFARTYGNVNFDAPKGWAIQESSSQVVITPPGTKGSNTPLAILVQKGTYHPPVESKLLLQKLVEKLEEGRKIEKRELMQFATDTQTNSSIWGCVSITKRTDGSSLYTLYLLGNPYHQAELIVLAAFDPRAFKTYEPEINNFLKSVSFERDGEIEKIAEQEARKRTEGESRKITSSVLKANSQSKSLLPADRLTPAQRQTRNFVRQQQFNAANQAIMNWGTFNWNSMSRSMF